MCFFEVQYCCVQQSPLLPDQFQAGLSLMVYFQINAKETVVILGFATCEIQYRAGKDLISPNPTGKP